MEETRLFCRPTEMAGNRSVGSECSQALVLLSESLEYAHHLVLYSAFGWTAEE